MKKTENSKEKVKKTKNGSKPNTEKKVTKNKGKKGKGKIWKRVLIAIVVLMIIAAGVCAGIIFGLAGKYAITKNDLVINYSNSTIVDKDGKVLAVLSAKENRKILTKSEMGEYLPKAFVAIEDKRFNSHHGVDIKRSAAAVFSFILHRGESSVGGGSTITQQLVKNITNEKDASGIEGAVRKIKEMARAYQVEDILSKDQILELYMNIIFLGGRVYGVGMASEYYFSKDAEDLSLAESAFIAGITHSPNYYNPFIENPRTEKIKSRTKTVLKEMKDQGKINEEEYNKAVEEVENGLKFKEGTIINKASYSSHTEALIKQIINQLVTEKGMDREYAETYLYSSGFKIYSTEVESIQEKIEDEYAKSKYRVTTTVEKKVDGKTKKEKEDAQSAMVIIDHTNGHIVGAVGVLGEKGAEELNRITVARQPGSSIKPIAVYGPALQEGVISISSVYEDKPLKYGSWTPKNSYSGFRGAMNMRQAVKVSCNTVAIQVLADLGASKSIKYLEDLGVTSVNEESDNNLPLALGGMSRGISPLQMAAAYATIANDGEYITPIYYTKMEDSDGNTILEPKQEKRRVFSELNAYLLKELLTEPTKSGGTATNCTISGMSVGAKTGTTNEKKDKWLCGFTPYYTAAVWYGYDTPTAIPSKATSNANTIWKNVMASVHKGLKSKKFEKPSGMVTAVVCKDSGLLATDLCKNDVAGNRTYTEYFVKGTVPKKTCDCHVEVEICKKSNKLAGEFCTEKEKKTYATSSKDKKGDSKDKIPTDKCDVCKADSAGPVITLNGNATINLKVGEKYVEQGAKAVDAVDGDVTSKIITTGTVNTAAAGTYTITYTVSDSSGNTSKATRTVKVTAAEPPKPNTNTTTNTTTEPAA